MKRLFVRPKSLTLIVALAAVAAMCTVSAAYAASPGGGGARMRAMASRATSASSTPCSFTPATTCQSTDPTVTLNIYYYGDTSACTFIWDVAWGDGNSSSNLTVTDPPDGYVQLASHTYAIAGTYTISVTGQVTSGDCVASPFTVQFTLLPPPTLPSESNSWAGYVAGGSGPYHHVQATWRMPGNKGTKVQEAITAFWVGFDGDNMSPGNIEQCGTQILEAPDGEIRYAAFYEVGLQAGAIKHPPIAVHPGDYITAVANYAHGAFQCILSVRHRGVVTSWSTGPIKGKFPLATAEVITEAPGHPNIPLAPFGAAQYTNVNLGGQGTIYPVAMYTLDGLFEAVSTSPFQGQTSKGRFSSQYIRSETGF